MKEKTSGQTEKIYDDSTQTDLKIRYLKWVARNFANGARTRKINELKKRPPRVLPKLPKGSD